MSVQVQCKCGAYSGETGECLFCGNDIMDTGALRLWQISAIDRAQVALRERKRPVVSAVMGAGKSVVIAELVRTMAFDSVVVTVPTQALVRQLARTLEERTGRPVGQWYADCKELWPVTVVCHPSLSAYEKAYQRKWKDYDMSRLWIADECHKTECDTVLDWASSADLHARIGFTATPWRASMSETISSFDEAILTYSAEDAYRDGHIVKPKIVHADAGDTDQVVADWICAQLDRGYSGVANATSIDDAEAFAQMLGSRGHAVHSRNLLSAEHARMLIASSEPRCVVYVDMLAEGFDCPQIRYMALRRPVGSRVRFAQEVGRGLRSCHPIGKDRCVLLDVWDLWNIHSMTWKAALGDAPELQRGEVLDAQLGKWEPGERMPHEVLPPLRSWLRSERVRMQFEGLIDTHEIATRSWRSDPVSRKQAVYLDSLMTRVDPKSLSTEHRTRIRAARRALHDCLARDPDDLKGAFRKGDASDLIDIVRGLS